MADPANPLIVQADRSLFLEVHSPLAEAARAAIAPFAELEKSPEHLHTYRVTPLSIWNACSAGLDGREMLGALERHAKYPVPDNVARDLLETAARYGRLRLLAGDETPGQLLLAVEPDDAPLLADLVKRKALRALVLAQPAPTVALVDAGNRGLVKQALLEAGWPVLDEAGFVDGARLDVRLAPHAHPREYQVQAARAFHQAGSALGGSGVVVLPPGSGKTLVGILTMTLVGARTLVLTTNRTSVEQWRRELLERTNLTPDDIAEYAPSGKRLAPVTLSTYQMVTRRSRGEDGELDYANLKALSGEDWGLIVYDEVHLLPAPVFRLAVEVQARRRLGLTATLLREDGLEGDVFSLIGPKRYDMPWKALEQAGWIAAADCREVRVPLPKDERVS
ncbi:MAG TPA: helicase-associated domain-containing protein, partial [Deinococcales bacterium]|nr:helicase-associated domain-containing protein [Deinococcales bacterium]